MNLIGTTISHYRILQLLGGGAMGVVYKAEDLNLGRFVALKFLRPYFGSDRQEAQRFLNEARAASALDHPNIAVIHEVDETDDGQMYIVMAFYEGETIKEKVARGPLPLQEAVELAIQISAGLDQAHARGIVHRDIKPANVLVTADGTAKILDFGLAKLAGTTLTRSGTTVGTAAYMSPESAMAGTVGHRADIWSLGVVLYEMVTGELPFRGESAPAVHYSVVHDAVPSMASRRSGVPDELERVVATALAKNPGGRFQAASEVAAELRSLAADLESQFGTAPPRRSATASRRPSPLRRAWRRGLTAAMLAAALLTGGVVVWQSGWLDAYRGQVPIRDMEAQRLFERARVYEERGDSRTNFEHAEQMYRSALRLEAENPFLRAHLATLLTRVQLYYPSPDRAREIEELVAPFLDGETDLAEGLIAAGRYRLLHGDAEGAATLAAKAKRVAPDEYSAYVLRGEALITSGNSEEGLEELRRGVDVGEGHLWARSTLALKLTELGRHNEAAAEYEKVLEYAPDSPNALNNLASLYLFNGRYLDSIPLYRRVLELQPDDVAASNLGSAYYYLDRLEEAIEAFELAARLAPEQPTHKRNLGDAYEKRGDPEAAEAWFSKALEAYDRALAAGGPEAELTGLRAVCAAKLGRFEDALDGVERARSLEPDSPFQLYYSAQVYALIGDREQALDLVRRAVAAGYPREEFRRDLCFRDLWQQPEFLEILIGS